MITDSLMKLLCRRQMDLKMYLQMRQAKGYMSVDENDALRDSLFECCCEIREKMPLLKSRLIPAEQEALTQAADAIASAAVCLMTGYHDSSLYITVNARQLTGYLRVLTLSIERLLLG
ncbi:biofilm formation regulator BssR [Salmonella enterica]|nr:biofilm formation regulator BssR [Salmonella enterica subsp. enterica serovar Arechavaleta]EJL5947511.1 biofilm formation regulator BssR [Salmonella enterica]